MCFWTSTPAVSGTSFLECLPSKHPKRLRVWLHLENVSSSHIHFSRILKGQWLVGCKCSGVQTTNQRMLGRLSNKAGWIFFKNLRPNGWRKLCEQSWLEKPKSRCSKGWRVLSSMCLPGVSLQFVGGPKISYTLHLGVSMCFPLVLWCLLEVHTLVGKSGYRLQLYISTRMSETKCDTFPGKFARGTSLMMQMMAAGRHRYQWCTSPHRAQ